MIQFDLRIFFKRVGWNHHQLVKITFAWKMLKNPNLATEVSAALWNVLVITLALLAEIGDPSREPRAGAGFLGLGFGWMTFIVPLREEMMEWRFSSCD